MTADQDRRITAAAVAAVVAAGVVAAGLAAAPGWLPAPGHAPAGFPVDRPALPERFADWRDRTATVADAPPGPAIAAYTHQTARTVDLPVIVAADGRTYRHLDGDLRGRMTNAGSDAVLLAPDGSRLAGGGGALLDLSTGERTIHPVLAGDGWSQWRPTVPQAWSPDGRWLAYGQVPTGQVPRSPERPDERAALALLDLASGETSVFNVGDREDGRVAFSPEGSELAVSTVSAQGPVVRVFHRSGELLRELKPPDGFALAPYGVAWSPDGARLVVQDPRQPQQLAFLNASDGGAAAPDSMVAVGHPHEVEVVGWRDAETLLVAAHRDTGGVGSLILVPADGGPPRVVSELPSGGQDHLASLRFAPELLAAAELGTAGPADYGPVGPRPELVVAAVAGTALAAVLLVWRLIVRRRRGARRTPGGTPAPDGDERL